ncbi:MAG: SCP2 sterol-binding domain-containing protein [Actinomycetota bacterium]
MGVKFLSTEWVDTLTTTLNGSQEFAQAAGGKTATIQQIITSSEGDTHYWTTISDGSIAMGVGDSESADATITQSYDTAVALAKRELSPVTGFMMGKIKIAGNMGLVLGLQGVLTQIADTMATLDVDY